MRLLSLRVFFLSNTTWLASLFLLNACGTSRSSPQHTIISTGQRRAVGGETTASNSSDEAEDSTAGNAAVPSDLREQLIRDGQRAAEVLLTAACKDTSNRGVFATVYALRDGLRPDAACVESTLLRGIRVEAPLLRALAWRHLVTEKKIPLPKDVDFSKEPPTLQALAALAYLTRSLPVPAALRYALAVPSGTPPAADKSDFADDRIGHLAVMARPFDDGLLASGTALEESQFTKATELSDSGPVWTAARIRGNLLHALGIEEERLDGDEAAASPDASPTVVGDLLENRLAEQPEPVLCNIALSAPSPLRIEALRALVIRAGASPAMCALGASAAAFRTDDADLQIEGARTFLALVRGAGR